MLRWGQSIMSLATQIRSEGAPTAHPFVTRLMGLISFSANDLKSLDSIIDGERFVKKRKDLVVVGHEFLNLCFVRDGYAIRYKLLHSGKRQILNVILPGDVIGFPVSFFDRSIYSVVAISDLTYDICSLDAYVRLCYEQPQFGLVLVGLRRTKPRSMPSTSSISAVARPLSGLRTSCWRFMRACWAWVAPRRLASISRFRRRLWQTFWA